MFSEPDSRIHRRHTNMVDIADNFVSSNISDIFRSMFGTDLTPTDDVLERLKIPEGQRQNRLSFISEAFYKYLCWQVGSKKRFNVRRLLFNKRIHEFRKFTDGRCIAQIGSKSEGFFMRGSDQDVLVSVAEAQEKKNVTTNITFEYVYNSSVNPGYVMIEKFQHGTPIGIFQVTKQ
ncbi:unnamed protein product [Mytilus edulis]|uniref:Uncharacterized protein n=1 Tax=Mytilus edulis TaxID=6550 RepID=A0A8S3S702_MYTED|nr:unnamed protein product [Mytilus edulis]